MKGYKRLLEGENPSLAIWGLFIIGLIILIFIPLLLTQPTLFTGIFNYSQTGQIGDTISGITMPFLTLLGAFLTFLAFWIQIKANKTQTEQFKKQDLDTKRDRFENKFYELLKIQRDNVTEMEIRGNGNLTGRRCFIHMFNELRFIYSLTINVYRQIKAKNKSINENELFNLSYLLFFYGLGTKSNKILDQLLVKYDTNLIQSLKTKMTEIQETHEKKRFVEVPHPKGGVSKLKIVYYPFYGHEMRLGYYFQHLHQLIQLVLDQDDQLIENKISYIDIIRAQLSTFEQLLIYYYAISYFGEQWLKNDILTDFKLIKNLPLPQADFSISPKEFLGEKDKNGEYIFEWDNIANKF